MGRNDRDDRWDDREPQDAPPPRLVNVSPTELGFPERPVDKVELVRDCMEIAAKHGFNLLAPPTSLDWIPEGYRVAIKIVRFPMDGTWVGERTRSNGTWYTTDNGGYALHKPALRQLAHAANVSVDATRIDDRSDPFRWEYKAIASMKGMDGSIRSMPGSKDYDLRDEGPIVRDMVETAESARPPRDPRVQIRKARAAGSRMAETKAISAAIRELLSIKVAYTKEEACRPFLFPMMVWVPTGPEAQRMIAARELGIVEQVYGPKRGPVIDVTEAHTDADTDADTDQRQPARQVRQIAEASPGVDLEAELRRVEGRERVQATREQARPAAAAQASTREAAAPAGRLQPHPDDPPGAEAMATCEECGDRITDNVADYSRRRFQRHLCVPHQPTRGARS